MQRNELEKVADDLKEFRCQVVVVCWEAQHNRDMLSNLCCSRAIFWNREQYEDPSAGLLSPSATQAVLFEVGEDEEDEQTDAMLTLPPQPPPEPASSSQAPAIDDAARERVWYAQSGDSFTRAALREEGLLDVDVRPVGPVLAAGGAVPTCASELLTPSLPVGWPEKVPDGSGRLVPRGQKEQGAGEAGRNGGAEGLWIQMRPCESAAGDEEQAQRRPYCLLCEAWADEDEHLTSRRHVQAQRAVTGGPKEDEQGQGQGQEALYREPDVLPFPALHSIDLSYPDQEWPHKMRLLRIDSEVFREHGGGARPMEQGELGLLAAVPAEK